jgi:hypothetical protein
MEPTAFDARNEERAEFKAALAPMLTDYLIAPGKVPGTIVIPGIEYTALPPGYGNLGHSDIGYYGGLLICESLISNDARDRLVASWNACHKLTTAQIQANRVQTQTDRGAEMEKLLLLVRNVFTRGLSTQHYRNMIVNKIDELCNTQ